MPPRPYDNGCPVHFSLPALERSSKRGSHHTLRIIELTINPAFLPSPPSHMYYTDKNLLSSLPNPTSLRPGNDSPAPTLTNGEQQAAASPSPRSQRPTFFQLAGTIVKASRLAKRRPCGNNLRSNRIVWHRVESPETRRAGPRMRGEARRGCPSPLISVCLPMPWAIDRRGEAMEGLASGSCVRGLRGDEERLQLQSGCCSITL